MIDTHHLSFRKLLLRVLSKGTDTITSISVSALCFTFDFESFHGCNAVLSLLNLKEDDLNHQ